MIANEALFRQMVAHGLRGLDLLASLPEADPKRIAVMGASQGGGLSLLLAGLDPRVTLVAADFPFLSDWASSLSAPEGVYPTVRRLLEEHPERRDEALKTVSYFDAVNAAPLIRVPALIQVGLKDRTCPAAGIRRVYEALGSRDKRLVEFDADHNQLNAERWAAMSGFVVERLTRRSPGAVKPPARR